MAISDSAKILLSGGYERRRGYFSMIMMIWNQLTLTAIATIFGFFIIRLGDLLVANNSTPTAWNAYATQMALAGGVSSILIWLWRWYERILDDAIINLYPGIYLCERALLPGVICTVNPPKDVASLSEADVDSAKYIIVKNIQFGDRGHLQDDIIGIIAIFVFGVSSCGIGIYKGTLTLSCSGQVHLIGWLLVLNGIGIAGIIIARCRWKIQEHYWPVPKRVPGALSAAECAISKIRKH